MANEEQLAILRRGAKDWNLWRQENLFLKGKHIEVDLSEADLSGANLSGANFSGLNFSGASLSDTDLSRADLSGANFSGLNFSGAKLSRANLSELDFSGLVLSELDFSEANLSRANLSDANLSGANLSDANLSGLDLSRLDLSGLDLSGLDLSKATLHGTLCRLSILVGVSFKFADLTGACIQDWNINAETDFEDVICDYIFLKWDEENQKGIERRPSDPNRNFAPGDFERFIRQSLDTVDLIFGEGIDWNAFLESFQGLQLDSEVGELSIAGIKKNRDGSFVVQINVPTGTDKGAIERGFRNRYQLLLDKQDKQIKFLQGQLEYSQDQVKQDRQNAAKFTNIIEVLAEKQGNTINQYGNFGIGANSGKVGGEAVVAGVYNEANKQAPEAIPEIQALLKQFETQYGSDTMSQQMAVATEVIKEIEQNQSLAQRIITAFKEGGISALDSYLDTPAASFVIRAIQSWYETSQKSE